MSKKIDKDIEGLKKCIEGMDMTSDRMKRATLEFLWDKYIDHYEAAVKGEGI